MYTRARATRGALSPIASASSADAELLHDQRTAGGIGHQDGETDHAVFQAALRHDGSLVAHALTIQIYNLYSGFLLF